LLLGNTAKQIAFTDTYKILRHSLITERLITYMVQRRLKNTISITWSPTISFTV